MAIKTDGTLWAIGGYNYQGQLGLNADTGTFVGKSSPIQVGALTDWLRIVSGGYHCLAVKTNGTLWSWGYNNGTLGLGNTTNRSSPVQVGGDTTWSTISAGVYHSLAVKSNGTMWAWGENASNGRLGLGDTTDRLTPTQIGGLTTWSTVSAGRYYGIAVKTDGTMWAWGSNNNGQLGLGNTTDRSSPVQVGALTNWLSVAGGDNTLFGIKTDGTLWSSGHNNNGQLGDGTTTNRSSPIQVGALTTWSSVASKSTHVMAFASV
jgi:alpha-tubulin suppressor-like RCC1 family protein